MAFVRKGRIPGDNKQPADLRNRGDDFLDHAIDEIFLLGITAHICEWQHGDRRLVGQGEHRSFGRRRFHGLGGGVSNKSVDVQRSRNVFDLLFTQIFERE